MAGGGSSSRTNSDAPRGGPSPLGAPRQTLEQRIGSPMQKGRSQPRGKGRSRSNTERTGGRGLDPKDVVAVTRHTLDQLPLSPRSKDELDD
eukprot:9609336-Karenia_brevis.AAC.1